ncbi:MAG: arginase family protein [Coriobacteriia bacterium]
MTASNLHDDPLWPRAAMLLTPVGNDMPQGDIAFIGVPAHATAITPTGANNTPAAVREALRSYSTYSTSTGVDVSTLAVVDLGDIEEPDGFEGEARVSAAAARADGRFSLVLAVGGDNSITFPLMRGLQEATPGEWGLITLDAHHDLRDGVSNGSPVRRLIDAGLPGSHIVQIGIADFSNSAAYARRAHDLGITVVTRASLRGRDMADVAAEALRLAGHGGRPVYVDIDVDVCDRAAVPGCPASAPGGMTADELRELALLLASDTRVRGIDITEVDSTADAPDGRTVRLAALLVLEIATGVALRADAR